MARLLGIQLPDDKGIEYALTLFYGIGWSRSGKILTQANIDRTKKVTDLTEVDIKKIIDGTIRNFFISAKNKRLYWDDGRMVYETSL